MPQKIFFNLRKQLRADSPDVKDMESVSVASRLRPRRAMLVEVSTNLALQMSSIFVFKESPRLQAGEDVNKGQGYVPCEAAEATAGKMIDLLDV